VVQETIEMVSFRNIFRDVEVVLSFGDVPAVAITEDGLRQVLLNLVFNAVDAMNGKGLLTVRTFLMNDWVAAAGMAPRRRAADPPDMDPALLRFGEKVTRFGVAVSITDTGYGISQEDLALVFDPFFTTKEPGKGTGLGLSVSKTIVDGVDGEIRIESGEGQGSTFTVILPEACKEDYGADV
jgi:signal transduction histidine kinase